MNKFLGLEESSLYGLETNNVGHVPELVLIIFGNEGRVLPLGLLLFARARERDIIWSRESFRRRKKTTRMILCPAVTDPQVNSLSFIYGIFSRIIPSFGRRFQTKESSALESIRELG